MKKKILVPTDFSDTAQSAINFAVQSSKLFQAQITLLHSYEVESDFSYDYMGYNKEFTVSMLSNIEKELDKLSEKILKEENVEVNTSISTYSLNEAIRKSVKETKADFVVMGTLGASGIKEKIWGSRTSSVIGQIKTPVMVIPHDYAWKKPSKILFLTNQFQKDEKILNTIFELAGLYMANIQISVYTDEEGDGAGTYLKNKEEIASYKDFIRSKYHEKAVTSTHLVGKDFEKSIHDFIQENEIDMLVMVTHQKGFWKRLFNPSLTEKMSFHTIVPLLAIPANS